MADTETNLSTQNQPISIGSEVITNPKIQSSQPFQQTNPLARKIQKILDTRLENDKELLDSLKALSSFFPENTLRTRRDLRSDVEKRSLALSEQFESQFRVLKEKVDLVCSDISDMSSCCSEMTQRLDSSKTLTSDLINKISKLQAESQNVEIQTQIAEKFIKRFQLTSDEMKCLRGGRDGKITEEFFTTLEKSKQIHNDCKLLLRSKQQRTGLEIMESMALYQETAYEKLYRWTQGECRSMTDDAPDLTGALCLSMAALEDRQVLFKYTLDELSVARRSAVVRCFIDALTRGGHGGHPRPIELHSHDPVRYVGDMLGWLHQAIANEKELLGSLLRKTKSHSDNELSNDLLNRITEGVCRPFKVRVEQVISAEPGAVVLFRLAHLLSFYESTIKQFLCETSSLLVVVHEMKDLAQKMFINSLSCYGGKLADKIEVPPSDLGPTPSLLDTMQLLKEILSSQDTSITAVEQRREECQKIFSLLIDPLLQSCTISASSLIPADMATYLINCIYQIQSTLAVYEFTDAKIEMLGAQVEAHSDTLITEQASFILSRSGLGSIFGVIREYVNTGVVMSTLPGLEHDNIKESMASFDRYLSSPDSLIIPQSNLIRSARSRDNIHKRAVDIILQSYNTVHQEILKEANKFNNPQSLLVRSPDQVLTLLG